MRIALHPTGEAGRRAGRILLAEAGLEALGIYGSRASGIEGRRAMAVTSPAGFTVLASDDATAPLDIAGIAVEDGLSCVLGADVEPGPQLVARAHARGVTLLVGASLVGLAEAMAHRCAAGLPASVAGLPASVSLLLAWTPEGKPPRRGMAVPFPAPLGARWGTPLPSRPDDPPTTARVVAPVTGPWAGALARATIGKGRRREERLVAVADDRRHLEGITLAAGALALAARDLPPGLIRPGQIGDAYLAACLRVGLEVAGLGFRS